ncbi:MAG: RNA polymerase sigma factor [Desulfobacterales bacterium]|nr:RNA polymerase sigma factor [Deltaproteobacteria bacterium]NNL42191.1 RNA polymerase sigma factor [Desulfobacterales bacterium]
MVKKAKAGSRSAFAELVDLFQDDIFKMVFYRTRTQMDAEDITQEVFMQAFKKLPGLKKVERFKSWLFSIAINRVRDFSRKKRFRSLFHASDTGSDFQSFDPQIEGQPEAVGELVKQDFWKQIGMIMDKLSRMEREVFLLRFLDLLSIREISSVLHKNESTIKTYLYRALVKFRQNASTLELFKEEMP